MYGGIESSRLIEAFKRHVPECYVRDFTGNRGYLTLCKGRQTLFDFSKHTDKFSDTVPKWTLANLNPGYTPEKAIYDGAKLLVPGWRMEMRRAAEYLTPHQKRLVSREMGMDAEVLFLCH